MLSLILASMGILVALAGVLLVVQELGTVQDLTSSLGGWVIRAGLFILLASEFVALFRRPDLVVTYKIMLLGAAAIVFLGLTLLPLEWRRGGFTFQRSLSWQVIAGGLGVYLGAVMFIQWVVMLIGVGTGWLIIRASRRWLQTMTDPAVVSRVVMRAVAGLAVLTLVLLFF
jgi:hypothetical protein